MEDRLLLLVTDRAGSDHAGIEEISELESGHRILLMPAPDLHAVSFIFFVARPCIAVRHDAECL